MDERLDGMFLVVTALLLCATGVGAFWLADIYHVSPLWVFFAWNSGLLLTMFMRDFRARLRRPTFVVYLATWAAVHGVLIVGLIHWHVPFALWLVCMTIELTFGYWFADYLFDERPTPG